MTNRRTGGSATLLKVLPKGRDLGIIVDGGLALAQEDVTAGLALASLLRHVDLNSVLLKGR